jgi:putative SOS response-associated peptidase YedK
MQRNAAGNGPGGGAACVAAFAIAMVDGSQMVLAGLWAKWTSPKGEEVLSCTVLTCAASGIVGELHDRMPVILPESEWPKWLGEEPAGEDELVPLLKPCADDPLKVWPVGKQVGNIRNVGPALLLPIKVRPCAPAAKYWR